MNKISKLLMALMITGMSISAGAAEATLSQSALSTDQIAATTSQSALPPSSKDNVGQPLQESTPLDTPVKGYTGQPLQEPTFEAVSASVGTSVKKKKCPAHATCSGNAANFICNAGYYKKSAKATACTKCPAGYKCQDNKHVKCSAGTYAAAGSSKCSNCSGSTYSAAGATKCKTCPTGQKPNSTHTKCEKACPKNATCSGSSDNFICNSGYYKISGIACTKCPKGYYCPGDNKKYKSGSGLAGVASATVPACPKGKKLNAARTACVKA